MYLMIKATGAVFVILGGLLIGKKVKDQYKNRCKILKQMQEALKQADDLISIENTLLDDVLKSCAEKCFENEKGKDVWTKANENLKREFGSFENAWIKACDEYFENSPCLEEKDKECIREIGKALGIANTQRQNDHVKSKIQKLQELEKMAMEKEEKEGKNAIKIALAISVAIIVILF